MQDPCQDLHYLFVDPTEVPWHNYFIMKHLHKEIHGSAWKAYLCPRCIICLCYHTMQADYEGWICEDGTELWIYPDFNGEELINNYKLGSKSA